MLYNGDCLDVLRTLPDKSIDLVLTDPPYNLGLFMKSRATNLKAMRENNFVEAGWDNLDFDGWKESMGVLFRDCSRVLKTGGSLVMFMSLMKVESVIAMAQEVGFYYKTTGVWHKTNPMPRNMNLHFVNSTEAWLYFTLGARTGTFNNEGRVLHDHIEGSLVPSVEKKHGKHPTQKPLYLMEHFVRVLSNEGDVVLDPFMGSGSTGIACKNLGREFIGIEKDEGYFKIAKERMGD